MLLLLLNRAHGFGNVRDGRVVIVIPACCLHSGQVVGLVMMLDLLLLLLDRTGIATDVRRSVLRRNAVSICYIRCIIINLSSKMKRPDSLKGADCATHSPQTLVIFFLSRIV